MDSTNLKLKTFIKLIKFKKQGIIVLLRVYYVPT